tara:strand:+ start:2170 stop:2463 length:294 start_codon:yes stop_codon:yes gene_type:complete
MKRLNSKRVTKALCVISALIASLIIGFLICINFIVDPIIYWLASTEGARLLIACILSWFGVSTLFDILYERYKRKIKIKRFNALNVPYPRTFRGRGY